LRKAGGIVALIAGIFSLISSVRLLSLAAFVTSDKEIITKAEAWAGAFGGFGIIFSILVITSGAISINVKSKIPGILIVIGSISGAILGGGFVAIFMVLALIGGILILIGDKGKNVLQQNDEVKQG
jgi:hypothetical protein